MNNPNGPPFLGIALKTIVTHTITYFAMGFAASAFLDYSARYATPPLSYYMRQFGDPMISAGPLFQPIRGLLFAVVFYLLREPFFGRKNGWLILWLTLLIVGILSPFGPTPGSLEGMIYTQLPFLDHLLYLPEAVLQSLLLSVILFYWVNHPEKKWIGWAMGILFVLLMLLPLLGLLVETPV